MTKYYLLRGEYCVGCDAGKIPAVINKAFTSLYKNTSEYADVNFGEHLKESIFEKNNLDYNEFEQLLAQKTYKAIFINVVSGLYCGLNGAQPIDGVVYVIAS